MLVLMSLSVLERVSRKMVCLSRLLLTQAYADSSTLNFLVMGLSSDCCPSESNTGGLEEHCVGSNTLPFLAAAPTSAS